MTSRDAANVVRAVPPAPKSAKPTPPPEPSALPRASRLNESNAPDDEAMAAAPSSSPTSSVWQKAQRRRTNPGKPSSSGHSGSTASPPSASSSSSGGNAALRDGKVRASTTTAGAFAHNSAIAAAAAAAHTRQSDRRVDLTALDDDGDGVLMRYSRAESSAAVGDYEDGDIAIASYVGKSSRNATNTTANSLSSRSRSGGSNVNNSGNNTNSNYNVNDNDDGDHPPPPADSDSGDDDDSDGTAGLAMSSQLMAKLKLGRSIDAAAVEPKRVGSGMLRVGDVANGLHCNECGMFCADDHVLFVHKQQAHKSPTGTVGNSSTGVPRKPTSPQPVLSPTATLRCGLCHKTMSTKAELDAHVEKHESDLGLKDVATTTLGALYGLSKAGDAVSASGKTEKVSLAALGGAASAPTSSTPPAKKTKKKLFGSSSGKQKSSDGKK